MSEEPLHRYTLTSSVEKVITDWFRRYEVTPETMPIPLLAKSMHSEAPLQEYHLNWRFQCEHFIYRESFLDSPSGSNFA